MGHYRLLTRAEVAKFLSVTHSTLSNLAWKEGGPTIIRLSARCVRYALDDLIAWAKSKQEAPEMNSRGYETHPIASMEG